jgi:uncharacterized protein (TIGR02145 family)
MKTKVFYPTKIIFKHQLVLFLIILSTISVNAQYLSDIDGNQYKTIIIGKQTWMAENLKVTNYNDGMPVPLITGNSEWGNLTSNGYCYFNNSLEKYGNIYGALYNWYVVESGKICPKGWHVPSEGEWSILYNHYGGRFVAGNMLKESGNLHWTKNPNDLDEYEYGYEYDYYNEEFDEYIGNERFTDPSLTEESSMNKNSDNVLLFNALPGALRFSNGNFIRDYYSQIGFYGYWWSSTSNSETHAKAISLSYLDAIVHNENDNKKTGYSIRCIKDN